MQRRHSPAYVAEIRKKWRVVVPIRGRLSPPTWPQRVRNSARRSSMAAERKRGCCRCSRTRPSVRRSAEPYEYAAVRSGQVLMGVRDVWSGDAV